jgi:hypothetical protein
MPTSLNALAERIRRGCKITVDNREAWNAATIDIATALAEARDRLSADREYHTWCVENELDIINRDDRAALVNMARNLDLTRIVLAETKRTSWLLIWREEILPRCRSVTTPEGATVSPAVTTRRRRREKLMSELSSPPPTEPPAASSSEGDAPTRLIEALDTLVRIFDTLDLAAARRGLNIHQRKHVEALKVRVRNWLDVLDASK